MRGLGSKGEGLEDDSISERWLRASAGAGSASFAGGTAVVGLGISRASLVTGDMRMCGTRITLQEEQNKMLVW